MLGSNLLIYLPWLIILLLYAFGPWSLPAEPSTGSRMVAWSVFATYVVVTQFADGQQNSTRNLARVLLIRKFGTNYDSRLISPLQHVMMPEWFTIVGLVYWLLGVASFGLLLFTEGWKVAVPTMVGYLVLGAILPVFYRANLLLIHRSARLQLVKALASGRLPSDISAGEVYAVIREAVEQKKNPQRWWAEELAIALRVSEE